MEWLTGTTIAFDHRKIHTGHANRIRSIHRKLMYGQVSLTTESWTHSFFKVGDMNFIPDFWPSPLGYFHRFGFTKSKAEMELTTNCPFQDSPEDGERMPAKTSDYEQIQHCGNSPINTDRETGYLNFIKYLIHLGVTPLFRVYATSVWFSCHLGGVRENCKIGVLCDPDGLRN
ncbi:hypothetical protein NQ315_007996 [Exocentrus adspersus]|uniref:Uncharacterized protein n=1 Tax=Exocentrus adspersus TaxID=1586481 RepID=A0AAV8VF80_9CUCU|nr:hypothetical protein NQ315_007996 [Exocentrus adspersus]